jgi:ornithine carbamoyltransferase
MARLAPQSGSAPASATAREMRHLLTLADLSSEEIKQLVQLAGELKRELKDGGNRPLLQGKTLGMIFQRPSLRTRVSFEVATSQLGGEALYLSPQEIQLGERESVQDVARVLSRYVDGLVARVYAHRQLEELAASASVPVINGLSERAHPCEILGDLLTIQEKRGTLKGLKLAYVGDGNNIAHSLLLGASMVGMEIRLATPQGYSPRAQVLEQAREWASQTGATVVVGGDARHAVEGVDVIYTDVWASMGREAEREARLRTFRPYQVNRELVALAKPDVIILHCLPARRGEEITGEVLDGPRSIVGDQAENKLHMHKAILAHLLAGSGGAAA